MTSSFLQQALIYLAAAILFVPIAKRLGMGSVLGYLLAGIAIGPFALGFVGAERSDIQHFAEFGVVMMLFLIGLELEPGHIWQMRRLILGSGTVQLCATTLLIGTGFALAGFPWQTAVAVGLALSMSSTAIVLQSFREKGLEKTLSGRSAFAVLLFQDIAVIPVLAVLPLLALQASPASSGAPATFLAGLPGWAQTLALLGAVGLVVLAGRFLIVPCLRFIARANLRELFTASALLIVVGAAYLMHLVGLSPALGTFLAGVVLANSEYQHELEGDIEPFKGILLGLFFISVGASINFSLLTARPLLMFALVSGVIAVKAVALLLTGRLAGLAFDQNSLFALGLAQVGEFAFVLFSFMHQLHILTADWTDALMGATAISMMATPLLLLANDRLLLPRFGTRQQTEEKAADAIDLQHPVIIAGFGPFGSTVGRFLRANGVEATILDNDSDRVDMLRRMGFKVFYGDATRIEILEAAGAARASLLIAAIGIPDINRDLVAKVRRRYPQLKVLVRCLNRQDAFGYLDLGIEEVYRETLDTSIRLGMDALIRLGHRRYSAFRAGQSFLRYDEASLSKLALHRHDKSAYLFNIREQIRIQEELLANDREVNPGLHDHAWDSNGPDDPSVGGKGPQNGSAG
jgi:CPA2 family monovalent cation:H+ antiporter-2